MKKGHLFIWLTIFLAGCSTPVPAAIEKKLITTNRPVENLDFPSDNEKIQDQKENRDVGDMVDPGTEPTDTETPNNFQSENQNKQEIVETETTPKNNRVDGDKEYLIPPALLPYDGITPIYEPEFVTASQSPLTGEELVMGVSINRESKAYPVTVLRFREMVDDELGSLPILVTW